MVTKAGTAPTSSPNRTTGASLPASICFCIKCGEKCPGQIKNAVEALANRSDGEIVLTLSVQGRWVQIEVADNGSGIAPALQDQIFEMIFTTKSHGMGIGLWLSRRIAQTHGGDLACVSSPRGARMRLTLPRV